MRGDDVQAGRPCKSSRQRNLSGLERCNSLRAEVATSREVLWTSQDSIGPAVVADSGPTEVLHKKRRTQPEIFRMPQQGCNLVRRLECVRISSGEICGRSPD